MNYIKQYYQYKNDLTPWSITKITMAVCPFIVNKMIEEKRMYDFKGIKSKNIKHNNLYAGIAIHEMLENWHKAHLDLEDFASPGEIIASYNIIKSSDWLKLIKEFERAKMIFAYDNDNVPQFAGGKVLGAEEIIEVDKSGKVCTKGLGFLKGTLDLVQIEDDMLTITDYKRQYNVISATDLTDNFQMQLYAYLAACAHPEVNYIKTRMYFTRYGSFTEIIRSISEVKENHKGFNLIIEAMESKVKRYSKSDEDPEAIPGEHCELCEYTSICPVIDEFDGVIKDEEDAKKAAALLKLRTVQRESLTDSLKKYTSVHGAIDSGKEKIGYLENKTRSWEVFDENKLLILMNNKDIRLTELFSPDSKKAGAFMNSVLYRIDTEGKNEDKELLSELKKCIREKRKTTFKSQNS